MKLSSAISTFLLLAVSSTNILSIPETQDSDLEKYKKNQYYVGFYLHEIIHERKIINKEVFYQKYRQPICDLKRLDLRICDLKQFDLREAINKQTINKTTLHNSKKDSFIWQKMQPYVMPIFGWFSKK